MIFSIRDNNLGLTFDYSKNVMNSDTFKLLMDFVKAVKVNEYVIKMFSGEKIDCTEQKAVLHTVFRNRSNNPIYVDGKDVMLEINAVLEKMEKFSNDLRSGRWCGATGKRITDLVNIGIDGSNLGPQIVCEALKYYADGPNVYFVSNVDIDGADIYVTC